MVEFDYFYGAETENRCGRRGKRWITLLEFTRKMLTSPYGRSTERTSSHSQTLLGTVETGRARSFADGSASLIPSPFLQLGSAWPILDSTKQQQLSYWPNPDATSSAFPAKSGSKNQAIGIRAERGRSGGTYAHKDIAFAFASWISPEFHLFVIKDYQRLKSAEAQRIGIEWQARRELVKTNYRMHTDAIKSTLQQRSLPKWREQIEYASEADVINLAVFGQTAAAWRKEHEGWKGNMRDYATVRDLIILQNIEALSSVLIQHGLDKVSRFTTLQQEVERQRRILSEDIPSVERLQHIIESTDTAEGQTTDQSNESDDPEQQDNQSGTLFD